MAPNGPVQAVVMADQKKSLANPAASGAERGGTPIACWRSQTSMTTQRHCRHWLHLL